jgi:hypothetical protein
MVMVSSGLTRPHADLRLPIERDSLKDQFVVSIFIFATAGLLLWALVKPYVQQWLVVCTRLSLTSHSFSLLSYLYPNFK